MQLVVMLEYCVKAFRMSLRAGGFQSLFRNWGCCGHVSETTLREEDERNSLCLSGWFYSYLFIYGGY